VNDGNINNRVPSDATTGYFVDRNLGGTESAHEGNHRPSSSIDTSVDSGEIERALSALLYTHKIAHKTNEIARRSDRKDGEKTWLRQERGGIRNVRLSYLQSNTGSRGQVIKTVPHCNFFFENME
jgi:hypothetical protein